MRGGGGIIGNDDGLLVLNHIIISIRRSEDMLGDGNDLMSCGSRLEDCIGEK